MKMMISLQRYIDQAIRESLSERKTKSNSERLSELQSWLKDKDYPDYVNALSEIMKDPKAAALLDDAFGGEFGDIEFTFKARLIKASSLIPSQDNISMSRSIKYALKGDKTILKNFDYPVILNNMPLVTFRGNYVIDGHHRWAETMMVNPDARMLCFDYDADISPVEMMKLLQGAIATVVSKRDKKEVPSSHDINNEKGIYTNSITRDDIREYIKEHISDGVVNELKVKYETGSTDNIIDKMVDNVMKMRRDNRPMRDAQPRDVMPQPSKAGSKEGDKDSAYPEREGSALNRMKDGHFEKDVI